MLTMFEAKRGRWVYEGGELEQDSRKILEAITVCLGITIIVNKDYYGALCTIVITMTAEKVPSRRRL
jgi:hypothetical protein